ncbi:hypothetical protein MPL3365_170026 [Mesorhizobium plurifarium]|uniref:Uncharacterized protein n=1 Tax=Mesorhizobium plurifarium TaxID=69974 RepID=A0A090GTB6_MESPL|nr:hypothetical protein MPL3365_170026 [Mesorhizobium plurifarium]
MAELRGPKEPSYGSRAEAQRHYLPAPSAQDWFESEHTRAKGRASPKPNGSGVGRHL